MYIWANLDSAEESFQSKAAEKKDILYIIQIVQCSLVFMVITCEQWTLTVPQECVVYIIQKIVFFYCFLLEFIRFSVQIQKVDFFLSRRLCYLIRSKIRFLSAICFSFFYSLKHRFFYLDIVIIFKIKLGENYLLRTEKVKKISLGY